MRSAAALALLLPFLLAATPRPGLTYRGCARIADATAVGLSGIAYDGREYWAVMDNSNQLVRLDVRLGGDGTIASAAVVEHLTLADRSDFEGVALTGRGTALISDE